MVVVVGPCPCTQDGGTNSPSVISYPIRTAIGRSAVSDSILTRCIQNFQPSLYVALIPLVWHLHCLQCSQCSYHHHDYYYFYRATAAADDYPTSNVLAHQRSSSKLSSCHFRHFSSTAVRKSCQCKTCVTSRHIVPHFDSLCNLASD